MARSENRATLVKSLCTLPLLALLAWSAVADDPVDHYSGEPSETLEQAVENFTEGTEQLRELLSGEVSEQDMADIHQLSYTLENAVAKLSEELEALGVALEDVHLASEDFDEGTVVDRGKVYMNIADTLRKLGD